jgi:hypothetical protein
MAEACRIRRVSEVDGKIPGTGEEVVHKFKSFFEKFTPFSEKLSEFRNRGENMADKVSLRNGFSDRKGIHPLNREIQYTSFDEHSRAFINDALLRACKNYLNTLGSCDQHIFANQIMKDLFSEIPNINNCFKLSYAIQRIQGVISKGDYDEVITICEYIGTRANVYCHNTLTVFDSSSNDQYSNDDPRFILNKVFEEEFIGYRFVGNYIVKITDNQEIETISSAMHSPFEEVGKHINAAVGFLGETGKQDYKSSINESMLALERLCNEINKTTNVTLGNAIKKVDFLNKLHPSLKEATITMISKLYGYSSDVPGIRHDSNNKDYPVSFEDAKYVLVLSCAFINWAIAHQS